MARQYCGQLGKQDNCQVAVSLSVATHQGSLPVAYRLYLPKEWADDAGRRATAGVPDDVCFQTKQQIRWRDGSNTPLSSRFARWRVRPARDDAKRSEPAPEEWLLIEWPEGAAEPDHH